MSDSVARPVDGGGPAGSAHRAFAYGLASLIVAADQASKIAVEHHLNPAPWGRAIRVIREILYVRRTVNEGGIAGIGNTLSPWIFATIAALFSLWVVLLIWNLRGSERRYLWALALLLGGFLGNGIDRVRNGYVTDFIYVTALPETWFSAFNLADLAIFAGLIWLCTLYLRTLFGGAKEPADG